jgi:hypothetical protein
MLILQTGSAAAAAAFATATGGSLSTAQPANAASKMWKPVDLPFQDTLYDIDFDT